MLYFTLLRASRKLAVGPRDEEVKRLYYCQFYSAECMVAQVEGKTRLFHITEIRSESTACISGYCVEGEDQL